MTRPKREKEYCFKCRRAQEYRSQEEERTKDDVTYNPIITRCLVCGSEIWMPCYCSENLNRFKEAYEKLRSEE